MRLMKLQSLQQRRQAFGVIHNLLSSGKEQDASTSSERVNSNTVPTSSGGDVGARMRQALEYKRSKSANVTNMQAASGPAQSADMATNASPIFAAAPTASRRFADKTFSSSSMSAQSAGFNGRLANLPPNAPLRVRNAISAAMQYRQDKAERSAAAAREAATQVAAKSADRARLAVNGAADALQQPNATAAQACVRQPSEEECKSVESSAAAASTGKKNGSVPVAEGILRGVRSKVAGDARQHISGDESFVPIAAPSPG